jgi:hypothetical protein
LATQSYTATVEAEGILRLDDATVEQLGLTPGDTVEVEIRADSLPPDPLGSNALLEIIGMFQGGRRDGSTNHDAYLYGPDEA